MNEVYMKFNLLIILMFFVCLNSFSQETDSGKLKVIIKGIAGRDGVVLIDLFNNRDGFPSKREAASVSLTENITNDEIVDILDNVKYGTYALSVVHDSNTNNKLDKSFFGIPKEGWSTSGYKQMPSGAPKYEKSVFVINTDLTEIELIMFY